MRRQNRRTSASGTGTQSYIFSDLSKQLYREQNMNRKLKHLQEQNYQLQEKIKQEEQQIKDQRIMIIYQMEQLTKAVNNKLNLFEDYPIERAKFANQDQAHKVLKDLMSKYENIQKQEKIIAKVKNSIQKMYKTYTQHKQSLQSSIQQNYQTHRQNIQKINQQIFQKKQQFLQVSENNRQMQEKTLSMQQQMQKFQREQQQLREQEKELQRMLAQKQKLLEQQSKKYQKLCQWTNIVVDKRYRYELSDQIGSKNSELASLEKKNQNIQIAINQQVLRNTIL